MYASPATVNNGPDEQGHSYQIFLFDTQSNDSPVELPPVLPQSNSLDDFVGHIVAVDIGDGPVLLYWSDFNMKSHTATVRGRFILSDKDYTDDFAVARKIVGHDLLPHTWNILVGATLNPTKVWYGHYKTAWGFAEATTVKGEQPSSKYHLYPVWPTSGNAEYARVSLSLEQQLTIGPMKDGPNPWVNIRAIDPKRTTARLRRINPSVLPPNAPELDQSIRYEKR